MFTSHNNYPPARQPFIDSARSYQCRGDFLMEGVVAINVRINIVFCCIPTKRVMTCSVVVGTLDGVLILRHISMCIVPKSSSWNSMTVSYHPSR
jgi:hypothetical protein